MNQKKYLMSGGLAFFEKKEMEKLSRYAREGWMLEKFAFLGFVLRKREPEHFIYSLDYQKEADEEYFSYFQEAGWTHVCSTGEMHIFKATPGTAPIYSDKQSEMEKYERESKSMKKVAVTALLVTIFLFLISMISNNGLLPNVVGIITEAISYPTMIVLIFSGMPYLAYRYKLKKLEKENF